MSNLLIMRLIVPRVRRLATQRLAARASCPAAARVSGCSRQGRSLHLEGTTTSTCTNGRGQQQRRC
eukprot:1540885-Prymnesium_polylepis.1